MLAKFFGKKSVDALAATEWPFTSPPNEAVVTVSQIIDGSLPILLVSHDAEDGGWQFLPGGGINMEDAKLVSLQSITRIDSSVLTLADLPEGFQATRANKESPWVRGRG